ncbi:hypothetical protein ACFXPX_13785 [Kitasatospora sp. NPDC059146]|uniref:hypothetical protein n=1 Tax=Kitasatospora sp. NPDC059146 TaxID=3346741 RepID=UPI00368B4331
MRKIVTVADDADLAHLVDLIDMLPGPDTRSFWGEGSNSIGSKVGHRLREILSGRGDSSDVDYLAIYVLKYLGRGNRHIPEDRITANLRGASGLPAAGHAWVEDATRTAFTLVTRYSLPVWNGAHRTRGSAWLQG